MAEDRPANPNHWLPKPFAGKLGERGEHHWQKWEDYVALQGLGAPGGNAPDLRVVRFKATLVGEARMWLAGAGELTYAQLRVAFLARYGRVPTEDEDYQTMLEARLQVGESYEDFAGRLITVGARLDRGPIEMRRSFMAGLPKPVRLYVSTHRPQTMEAALEACRIYGGIEGEGRVEKHVQIAVMAQQEAMIDGVTTKMNDLICRFGKLSERKSRPRDKEAKKGKKRPDSPYYVNTSESETDTEGEVGDKKYKKGERSDSKGRRSKSPRSYRCFGCGQKGHFINDCPGTKKVKPPGGCFNCGSIDHYVRNCPRINALMSIGQNACNRCTTCTNVAHNCGGVTTTPTPAGIGAAQCQGHVHSCGSVPATAHFQQGQF
jgi:hypothetical protein